jgi:hypothetical protein
VPTSGTRRSTRDLLLRGTLAFCFAQAEVFALLAVVPSKSLHIPPGDRLSGDLILLFAEFFKTLAPFRLGSLLLRIILINMTA